MAKSNGAKRPNILWYCSDQQRWDTIRALGQSAIETPTLDWLCALAGTVSAGPPRAVPY